MRNLLTIFLLVVLGALSRISAQGIEFVHDKTFEQVLEMAQAQDKIIFMDCYTTWCGPCKRLASMVFPDPAVGEYFNANFINTKFDMEKDGGPAIAGKYGIRAYPTLLWLDGKGNVIHKVVGGLDPQGLIAAGKKAGDPSPGMLQGMKKQYADGNRDVNFLADYMQALKTAGEKTETIFTEYISKLTEKDAASDKHIKAIFGMTADFNSPGLAYMLQHRARFAGAVGEEVFNAKINQIAGQLAADAGRSGNQTNLGKALELLKENKAADYQERSMKISMDYSMAQNKWSDYDKTATQYVKKYAAKRPAELNDIAWNYYLNINDNAALNRAAKWAQDAINLDNKYTYNLTYAYLLYKVNNLKEAEKACDYALIQAKQENIQDQSAKALREAIQKSLKK